MTGLSGIDNDIDRHNSIDAQAADWFTRNRNDHSHATRKAFSLWMAEPAHALAYHEFEQLWADLVQLQPLNISLPLPVRKPAAWRASLAIAAALVCALLAFNLGAPHEVFERQIAAHVKGSRTFNLPDGSTLHVNANTRLRIDFNNQQRNLYLDQGQLYLEVAPDKERPLWVHSGEATVRVVGTGFDVRRGHQQMVVSVAHGQVAFAPDSTTTTSTLLGARQQATWDFTKGTLQQQTLSDGEVADWRSGHLSFRNRELASLVDELNLYRAKPVLLADGPLSRFKVSGTLDVDDPDALIKALPALIPVKTVALADGRVRIEAR
ncbi:iron dicitrate transport regulator FecR [Pseudomonas frederiksbergensis]|uniref:Iron dicitrate transport regulator FecR n=1 Tax=Pseudomonas frederiksbergensis TaxID=104087 RepID=A0A1J0EHF2_9PSED|nr:FecR domain-containing protein [Pseudomonas frederiksbergensis]APC15541.1 iron dicitrate transport regulator FecR [Pseudomonas frederiksbergensis]